MLINVVFAVVVIKSERENGCEVYACAVERYDPDAKYLGHVHVEEEIGFVVRCNDVSAHPAETSQGDIADLRIPALVF